MQCPVPGEKGGGRIDVDGGGEYNKIIVNYRECKKAYFYIKEARDGKV